MNTFTVRSPQLVPWYLVHQTLQDHQNAALYAFRELLQLQSRMARIRSGTLSELALTHARLRILAVVAATPNLSMSQIARSLDLSRQAVHRVVHALERARMLALEKASGRRREWRVSLTNLGTHIAALALPWEQEWTSLALDNVSARALTDVAGLTRILRQQLPWTVQGPDDSARYFERCDRSYRRCLMQR